MGRLSQLVIDPGAFFERLGAEPSLAGPAAVVAVQGAAGSVEYLVFLALLGDPWGQLDGGAGEVTFAAGGFAVTAPWAFAATAVRTLLFLFALWGLGAAATYAVSRYFDADASPRKVAALLGWGAFPLAIRPVLGLLFTAVAALTAPEFGSEAAAREWAQTFASDPLRAAIRESVPLLAAWTAGLWLVAAERNLGLSRRQALAALALPIGWLLLQSLRSIARVL